MEKTGRKGLSVKRLLLLAAALLVTGTMACRADDSIWVYKKAFVETYHLDKNCPIIAGKKVKAYSLSDSTEVRQALRKAIDLADNCAVCKTPNLRRTKDSKFEEVLTAAMGGRFYEEEDTLMNDSTAALISTLTDRRTFDDELVAGVPEGAKVTTSIYKKVGYRGKILEVKKAKDERLVGATITCEVVNSQKSNISGAEGRLVLRPLFLTTENGTVVKLKHDDIHVRGRNRCNVKFWTSLFIVPLFIPGEGAKILPEDEFTVTLDFSEPIE